MNELKHPWSRWYESDANLVQLVRNIRQSPSGTRQLIALLIIERAHNRRYQRATHQQKVLGSDTHLGLLKSMSRKRWYDKDKHLYKAFNCLYLMPASMRSYLAAQMNDVFEVLTLYKQVSTQWNMPLSEALMKQLADQCLESSKQQALDSLKDWESRLIFNNRGQVAWRNPEIRQQLEAASF